MPRQTSHRGTVSIPTGIAWALITASVLLPGAAAPAEGLSDSGRPKCRGKVATIVGTPRDDDIVGTAKADVIVGGGGVDSIYGASGNDIICGGPGGSRFQDFDVTSQSLTGGPGDDVIVGGPAAETLRGGGGKDLVIGRGGDDFLFDDDDDRSGRSDVMRGGAGTDVFFGYGRRGADRLYGGGGGDRFLDPFGNNILRGGRGNDLFQSGKGDDTIVGGPGVDTGSFVVAQPGEASHCDEVSADLSTGVASGAAFGTDMLRGVENVATGGGEDLLIGDERANTFYVGQPCPGALVQRDSVAGGGGADWIDFNSEAWDYGGPFGPVVVDLANGTAEQRNPYQDTVAMVAFNSIENVTGTSFGDTILGDDGPNKFLPGPLTYTDGGDVMRGRGGDDDLAGSVGPDEIYGDEGADSVSGGLGNDRLDGGTGVNTIDGGKGRDTCRSPDRYNGAVSCEA